MLPTPPDGLRHWRPADADALAAAWADPAIRAWNPVPDGADAAAWIAGTADRWAQRRALDLVVEGPAGEVAGEVGLANLTRDPERAEVGVWTAAGHRRSGVAARGVSTLSRWALTDLGFDQLWARTDPANAAAEALFAGLGWDRLGVRSGSAVWSRAAAVLR